MYMIEIETKEMDKASEYAEKALKYMGKVMACLTEWEEEGGFGERGGQGGGSYGNRSMMGSRGGSYGNRGGYGNRSYGERDDDWEDEEEMMSSMRERRGVRGSGRGRR